jgi:hypothetical protein
LLDGETHALLPLSMTALSLVGEIVLKAQPFDDLRDGVFGGRQILILKLRHRPVAPMDRGIARVIPDIDMALPEPALPVIMRYAPMSQKICKRVVLAETPAVR